MKRWLPSRPLRIAFVAGIVACAATWALWPEAKPRVTFEARPFSLWEVAGAWVPSGSKDSLRWLSPHSLRPPWEAEDLPALGPDDLQRSALRSGAAICRVVIHNETKTTFWFSYTSSDPDYYRIQRGWGWTRPISLGERVDEGGTRFAIDFKPGERQTRTVVLPPLTEPFQVGARLMREPPAFARPLEKLLGRWMPPSLAEPREVFVWSETIEPLK